MMSQENQSTEEQMIQDYNDSVMSAAEDRRSGLVAHLIELRNRLLVAVVAVAVCFGVLFAFKEQVFGFISAPLALAQGGQVNMIFTAVGEQFFTYLKLSFLGGLFFALPILLWEVWRFLAPGLYDSERKVLVPFFIATPLLFYTGGAFMYYLVMPLVVEFFFSFQTENITAMPAVKEYLSFFVKMVFAFGFAFELPVLLLVLVRFGVVSVQAIAHFRRYAIVIIFAVAAVLTPPDPVSQIILASALLVLYEASILLARFVAPKG